MLAQGLVQESAKGNLIFPCSFQLGKLDHNMENARLNMRA